MNNIDKFLANALSASDMLTTYTDMALDNLELLDSKNIPALLDKITTTTPADVNEAGALAIIKYLINHAI